jgi:NADH-quinone oxidoreductase subunit H
MSAALPVVTFVFFVLVFPGFLFLSSLGLVGEYVDRKLYARLQNRVGPPFVQPLADFLKLVGKETILPERADPGIFKALPVFAFAAVVAAFLLLPVWGRPALPAFEGDVVVVIYLLTVPTLTFFLAGPASASLYSMVGALRSLTQLFAYEVPLYMAVLAPAILAQTWSLTTMAAFYDAHPLLTLANLPGLLVAIVALQGKLEKVPFDMPEAETEIVGGTFTEYSGRLLAIFRMALDMELVVGAALIATVFLPFGVSLHPAAATALLLVKVLGLIALSALIRTVMARLRIEQMVVFCWKVLLPVALFQLFLNVILAGVL